jgi:hypothetical protein
MDAICAGIGRHDCAFILLLQLRPDGQNRNQSHTDHRAAGQVVGTQASASRLIWPRKGRQQRRPYLKVIRTTAVSNNNVDETVTARNNRVAIMVRISHSDDNTAVQN